MTAAAAAQAQEDLAVQIAVATLVALGHVDFEDDLDGVREETLAAELRQMRRDGPELLRAPIEFRGEVLADALAGRPGEYLARYWIAEQEFRWQRDCAPRLECDCGHIVSFTEGLGRRKIFYRLNDDGEFAERVDSCPACSRDLRTVVARAGQQALFE